jgi:DNA repair exonuclease SbcCD ATPase subunit
VELDEVANELYAMPPGEFVAARDERVRQAREAGDRVLASALGRLRRPTQSAWLVNLLSRERRELLDELLEIGAEFRAERLTRERLYELSDRRRELLHRLQTDTQRLATSAGVDLTADRAHEVEATLAAAVADPDTADQVRSGRLTTALSYSGLGPQLQPARSEAPVEGRGGTPGGEGGPSGEPEDRDRTAAEAIEATEAAHAAQRRLDEVSKAWQDAVRRRDDLVRRRDELRTELRRIEQRLDHAEDELSYAEQDVQAAVASLEQARQPRGLLSHRRTSGNRLT